MSFTFTRRRRIAAAILLAAALCYAAFGFWAVPRLLRSQVSDFAKQHWQREPALGEIAFNPFTLKLEVKAFGFLDSRGAPLLSFDRLLVNLDVASLWRRGISFREIELDRPSASVIVRADGSLNLGELTAPFASPQAEPSGAEPARLFIDRFQLTGGVFEFEEHQRRTPFKARLSPVNFELRDFSTTGRSGNHYQLTARSAAGERFDWRGNFALSPLSSRGNFELADVRAQTLWSYLQESLAFDVADGLVRVSGDYHFAATEPQLTLEVGLKSISVADLGIRARGGDEDWVALERVSIDDTRMNLATRTVDIGTVKLVDGSVLARRDAQAAINLMSLDAAPAADAVPEIQVSGGVADTPWVVNAPAISIEALRLQVDDQFVKPAAQLVFSPVNLSVRNFSTAAGPPMEVSADVTLEQGGRLQLEGQAVAAGSRFDGKLSLEALNLAALQPYVGTYTQMTLLGGTLSSRLTIGYAPDDFRLAGDVKSAGLHTVDNALREDFLKWERLSVTGIDYRSRPESLRIASISARSPYVRFIIAPDQTTNVSKVLAMPGDAPGPVQTVEGVTRPEGSAAPMTMNIGQVQIEDGSANFADFWITPNYAVSLQQLGGTVTGLSSRKDSRARLALTGKIDRYAPVEIAGELNLLSASLFTDIRVKFDGVELTSVTPYSGRFAGYRIEKGKLSVDVRYQVDNRKLDAQQRFVVDQLTLGERVESPDAVNLPLRLAVALLKDRHGVIDLPLPITGSLDDPKFRVGPIIWRAFVNLLAGAATSPFKLLGGLFGGGEEVNLIDFEPGSAALDPASTAKLEALAKALYERPQLALEVPAGFSADMDSRALGAARLEEKLLAGARAGKSGDASAATDPARRFELLLALHRAEKPGAALPPSAHGLQSVGAKERELPAIETANRELEAALQPAAGELESALQALAQLRARNIQDALLSSGQVEPARVFMLATSAQAAADGKIRVALSLRE